MATILLIDDSPTQREAVEVMLAQHTVTSVDNAQDGLELARNLHPDLIICDVIMPGMDGYQFLERVRQDPQIAKLRVVLMSAYAFDYQSKYLADGYISKPPTIEGIEMLIRRFGNR